ncbi:hypothetical protein RHO12_05130 [Orbus sturtevantii]|uniref:hypothetical protein n=1 Tax=Orbus sturtevantii TaxID=3074109 RepID=UPI00370D5D85
MVDDIKIEQIELVLRKLNWAHEILTSAQNSTDDRGTADILSGVQFIINSASHDAEMLYKVLNI